MDPNATNPTTPGTGMPAADTGMGAPASMPGVTPTPAPANPPMPEPVVTPPAEPAPETPQTPTAPEEPAAGTDMGGGTPPAQTGM